MSRWLGLFSIFAAVMTGVVFFEVFNRAFGDGSIVPDSILDLARSAMFVLWTLAGVAAGIKEVRKVIDYKFNELALAKHERSEERKKVEVNAMMRDIGWNFSPMPGQESNDDGESQNLSSVIPIRNRRRASDTN